MRQHQRRAHSFEYSTIIIVHRPCASARTPVGDAGARARALLARLCIRRAWLVSRQRLAVGSAAHAERLPPDGLLLLDPLAAVCARLLQKRSDEALEIPAGSGGHPHARRPPRRKRREHVHARTPACRRAPVRPPRASSASAAATGARARESARQPALAPAPALTSARRHRRRCCRPPRRRPSRQSSRAPARSGTVGARRRRMRACHMRTTDFRARAPAHFPKIRSTVRIVPRKTRSIFHCAIIRELLGGGGLRVPRRTLPPPRRTAPPNGVRCEPGGRRSKRVCVCVCVCVCVRARASASTSLLTATPRHRPPP